jgi:hypothetical protein
MIEGAKLIGLIRDIDQSSAEHAWNGRERWREKDGMWCKEVLLGERGPMGSRQEEWARITVTMVRGDE